MTGEGSLGASVIPVFTSYLQNDTQQNTWRFARRVFWDMTVVLATLAALGAIFSRQIIGIYTFLGHQGNWGLAVYLNRIIFPAILFIGLSGVAMSLLHSFRVFSVPAAAPIFANLTIVACSIGVVYEPILRWAPPAYRSPAVALALGTLLGGIVQFALQVPALIQRGMSFKPEISVFDPGVQKVARMMGPAFFGMGVYQINLFVDTIFAFSWKMPHGSPTSLYLADRIMQLVLGSYAMAVSTALFPTMAHQIAAGEWDSMKRTFGFALRIVSFITIPAAAGLILLRKPIVQVFFQHGEFGSESTSLTAHALLFYALGLPAYAAIKLISPMYYSAHDTMTPARVGAYALFLNIALNALFVVFFFRRLSNGSPALASSLTAYMNFTALFLIFRKRYGRLGARALLSSFAKVAVCAVVMGAAVYAGFHAMHLGEGRHFLAELVALLAVISGAVAVYFGIAWLLRCEELSEFLLLLRRGESAEAMVPSAQ